MNYYLYKGTAKLGNEQCGTEGRHIFFNCTIKKVINTLKELKYRHYSIYSFINFYDDNTFKLIKQI